MAISEKVITFKRESRLREIIFLSVLAVMTSFAIIMTVLYATKIPVSTNIESIVLESADIIDDGTEQSIRIATAQMKYITYRIFPLSAPDKVLVSSDRTNIAWASAASTVGTQILIRAERPGTAVITVTHDRDKSKSVKITVIVSDIVATGVDLNWNDFSTDSVRRHTVIGTGLTRVLKPVLLPNQTDITKLPTVKSTDYKLDVLEPAGGNPCVTVVPSGQNYNIVAGSFCGKVRMTVYTTDSSRDDPNTTFPYLDIEVVLLPRELNIFKTANGSGTGERDPRDQASAGERLSFIGSVSASFDYNLKDYVEYNYGVSYPSGSADTARPDNTEVYGFSEQDKGLEYIIDALEMPDCVDAPDGRLTNGLLHVKPMNRTSGSVQFAVLIRSKYSVNIYTYMYVRIYLPVESVSISSPVINEQNSILNPVAISANVKIAVLFNNGSFVPGTTTFRSKVLATYNLGETNPQNKQSFSVVTVSDTNQIVVPTTYRNYGIVHIGVWSTETMSNFTLDQLTYENSKNNPRFADFWIKVENTAPLTGVTFVRDSELSQNKFIQIAAPAGVSTNLMSYLYPLPSHALIPGKVLFGIDNTVQSHLQASVAQVDSQRGILTGIAKAETLVVRVYDLSSHQNVLATYTITGFEMFAAENLTFRDYSITGKPAISSLAASYLKDLQGQGSADMSAYLNNVLSLQTMSESLGHFFVFDILSGAAIIDGTLIDVKGYSSEIVVRARVRTSTDGTSLAASWLDSLNHTNSISGEKAYSGATSLNLIVRVEHAAESIVLKNSDTGTTTIALAGTLDIRTLYSLSYDLNVGAADVRAETPKVVFSGDTDFVTVQNNNISAKQNLSGTVKIVTCTISIYDPTAVKRVVVVTFLVNPA